MTNGDGTAELEFSGEMLVPTMNFAAYREIYQIEGWMRRLCLAAWMGTFGSNWTVHINDGVRNVLEGRARRNRSRVYLGVENDSELIWQATHGELVKLLTDNSISSMVEELSGVSSTFLEVKLDEIREIRNVLAHNRALAPRTQVILAGLLASLEESIDTFKRRLLYADSNILGDATDLGKHFDSAWVNRITGMQGFVATHGNGFYSYVVWSKTEQADDWPSAERILSSFDLHLKGIVAILFNKEGGEYQVITPAPLTEAEQMELCTAVAKNPSVWTSEDFTMQNPRYVCSPKVWFYENRSPHYSNFEFHS